MYNCAVSIDILFLEIIKNIVKENKDILNYISIISLD